MSEITYFIFFKKVSNLTTGMDWFVQCSVHDTGTQHHYFPISFIFKCVSPCFCSGSMFHVHVTVENMHVHNALLNFVICCLP